MPHLPTHQIKAAPGCCPSAGRLDEVSVVPLALHTSSLQVGSRRDGMGVHHLQEQYLRIQGTGVRLLQNS